MNSYTKFASKWQHKVFLSPFKDSNEYPKRRVWTEIMRIRTWCDEILNGKYDSTQISETLVFGFELETDAMAFKIVSWIPDFRFINTFGTRQHWCYENQ